MRIKLIQPKGLIRCRQIMGRLILAYAVKKIGGIVGDILGAVEQVGETTILIVVGIVAMKIGSISWWLA